MLSIAVLCGKCCDPLTQLAHTREQHSSAGEPVSADAASTIAERPDSAAEKFVPVSFSFSSGSIASTADAVVARQMTTATIAEPPESDAEQFIPILETPQQELAYLIVNAFTDKVALDDPKAEAIIKTTLINKPTWPPGLLQDIDDMFKQIFFEFPNGIQDQNTWTPRDSREIIQQWEEAAAFRRYADADQLPHDPYYDAKQIRRIFDCYIEWFINENTTGMERQESRRKNRDRATARLERLCGDMYLVFGIWTVGLPDVDHPSSTDNATEHIQRNTNNILEWLSHLAKVIQAHKETTEYRVLASPSHECYKDANLAKDIQDHSCYRAKQLVRKWKSKDLTYETCTHGLTAAGYEKRTKAKSYQYARHLSQRWNNGTLTYSACNAYQWELLQKIWNGKFEKNQPSTKPTMPSFHKK